MTYSILAASQRRFLFPIAAPAQARQGSDQPATSSAAATQPRRLQQRPTPLPRRAGSGGAPVDADDAPEERRSSLSARRPRGSVIGDIPPENTLDARDVRATGATNINELLDAIAPQIGSAKDAAAAARCCCSMVSVFPSFREMRDIPTEAIQRVEILPEEVALKYGYSADQKVVNIVLRPRFRSTVAQLGAGGATEGGYANGNVDLTRLMIQKNGRTQVNLHAEGNTMLTEAERNIRLEEGQSPEQLSARSLVGTKRTSAARSIVNRQVLGDVSATLNTEVEHVEGRSLIGLGRDTLQRPWP